MQATLISDIEGSSLTPNEKSWLKSPYLGGIILFTRHFESLKQLKELVAQISAINPDLLITVDHEGGRVQRFRESFSLVPAMGKLGDLYLQDEKAAKNAAKACATVLASELLDAGIHLTYAPVLDINYERNTVIGDRAFSNDKKIIIELAESFMLGLKELDFTVVAKHFPGHGWVSLDSHVECPVDERSFAEIEATDLMPFKTLLPQIDWIMPAHVVYENIDSETAGFSKYWLQTILKEKLNFNGRIVSDDLSMAGAAIKGGFWQRAQAALNAGCDILLACNSTQATQEVLTQMAKTDIQPLSLKNYQPSVDRDNLLQNKEYLNAKQILNTLGLIA